MLVNCLTAKLMNRLTAKLVDLLTAKLVVVNLVKLHLTKLNSGQNFLTWGDSQFRLSLSPNS